MDAGCLVDGYRSDCTRTLLHGRAGRPPPRDLRPLSQAQLDALAAVNPGALGQDVDAASRKAIGEAGMAEHYGHGLGHGVGLDVHEEPNMRPESSAVSSPGTS